MKTVGIMQPYLFPYLGYWQLMGAVDQYVIYDDVQFIKGGWINRNNILIGGNKTLFTIALKDASPNKLINEIEVHDNCEKFLKTLAMAYSRAPYKDEVMRLLTDICNYPDRNLGRFIGNSIMKIAEYLQFDTQFVYSSDLQKDVTLRAQDKVIAIIKELGGERYLNAIGGQSLYSREDFAANGLELKFVKSTLLPYRQLGGEFVPGLSIIDVMMFNSGEELQALLKSYELI